MARTMTPSLTDNERVKELLAILQKHNAPQKRALNSVLTQVKNMEQQYEKMTVELTALREELAQAMARKHPARQFMQDAIIFAQSRLLTLRDSLAHLKQAVIGGCKRAVSAFQEQGISALDHVARFFRVKPVLESMRDSLAKDIQQDSRMIAKIEAISTEYHQAGRHLANIGRAITGKEPITEAKPMGKVAAAFLAPLRADRACCRAMKKHVESAISGIARLEERAERKPSIKKTMETYNQQITQEQKGRPPQEQSRSASHEAR